MSSPQKELDQLMADTNLFLSYEASRGDYQRYHNTKAVSSLPSSSDPSPSSNPPSSGNPSDKQIDRFLSELQRSNNIQQFGCLICFEKRSFKIVAHSENTMGIIGLQQQGRQNLLGLDVRRILTYHSSNTLAQAISSDGIIDSISNPLLLHFSPNMQHDQGKMFFAILHEIDVGVVIDLEPTEGVPEAYHVSGAYNSQIMAHNKLSQLLSFSHEGINGLCDGLVRTMKDFLGYDRTMIYKFDDDGHGEVVSEITEQGLEPYLGLHFPATDIPQIVRYMFQLNRARMVFDNSAPPVEIIQSEQLQQPLNLSNSTLRAPHRCHAEYMGNMGCKGSLVLPIGVNDDRMKLWGLLACHHRKPFYVPFPLRQACVLVVQTFEAQLCLKLQLIDSLGKVDAERKLLNSQLLLKDMDFPFVLNKSPSIMNILRCDGAAIFSPGVRQVAGVTPTPEQIQDIIGWVLSSDNDFTMWNTTSLVKAGCPNAANLGNVCGLAMIRSPSTDVCVLWFRSEAERDIKWGKAPQHLGNVGMNPRASFEAFHEIIKGKSLEWESWEIEAMKFTRLTIIGKDIALAEFAVTREFRNAAIPIFVVDPPGIITDWNLKMVELTGLYPNEVQGKSAMELVTDEYREIFRNYLSSALQGEAESAIRLRVKAAPLENQRDRSVLIVVSSYSQKNHKNEVIRVYFLGQDLNMVERVTSKLSTLEEVFGGHLRSLDRECEKVRQSGPSRRE